MEALAPVVIFTYKRLDTLKQTVQALQNNYLANESDLYIFSDNAKSERDQETVNQIRAYLKTIQGFKSITIEEASQNKGLAKSIIEGVSKVLENHNSVIVLEDDLISTKNFLDFMNKSLEQYVHIDNVFSVSGFSFDLNFNDSSLDTYFLNRGWSWGWATWKNRWEKVDWTVSDYNKFTADKKAQRKFAEGGSDLNAMLSKQMTGNLDSWAIRWFYNQFKLSGLTVYPIKSKILNGGFGADATHTTGSSKRYMPDLDMDNKRDFNFDITNQITKMAQKKFQFKMGIVARIKSKLQTLFNL